jgi:hypothetical protein
MYMDMRRSTNVAKVIVKSLKAGRLSKAAARAIRKRRVATADGGWTIVRTLDVNSPYFDESYLHAIRCNVAKARRENRRVLGVADFVPPKR